ncbi:MAG: ATP-dependent DNA helicase RecG [Schwartzia sp. (in: firmicutes)]
MEWDAAIERVKGIGPKKGAALRRLGLAAAYDLLTYYPRAYIDQSRRAPLAQLSAGEEATVAGRILSVSERRSGRGMTILTAMVGDGTGYLLFTWFNQPFLKKKLLPGREVVATGKVSYAYGGQGGLAMSQMQTFEILGEGAEALGGILPVYPATESLSQTFFRKILRQVIHDGAPLPEVIPDSIRRRYGLIKRGEAFRQVHFPASPKELAAARKRLAFEELYLIQCGLLLLKRRSQQAEKGVRHLFSSRLVAEVYESLPFRLTRDQEAVWREIALDMEKPEPMRRLVQGDVGSGKTVLALLSLVKTVENGYQGALMAPTEILARQHYETFTALLAGREVRLAFLSGRLTPKQHRETLARIAAHEADIVIGTQALIQDKVTYAALGLVVTDEQHRFGVAQRAELSKKGAFMPDMLVMTATPIPRTMTLTVYGDLDVSRIETLPPGRQPVRTFVRDASRRARIYAFVRQEIAAGRQAYVVCPRIEEQEEGELPSAEKIFEELSQGVFRDVSCGLVHGRLKSQEKERVMQSFYDGETKLLVATTVIEVGVHVPNATIMVVENADRFGLAQLHQLRGRIGRGQYQSYCVLIAGKKGGAAAERLAVMEKTADGFALAEEDLRQRGPGQFFGSLQHGIGDLKIANVLRDTDILLMARRAAAETIEEPEARQAVREVLRLQYRRRFDQITQA